MRRFPIVALSSALTTSTLAYLGYKKYETGAVANCQQPQQQQQRRLFDGSYSPNSMKPTSWDPNWDRREPSSEEIQLSSEVPDVKTIPTATRHVLLIRHGQYCHYDEGDHMRKLTELGRQQASHTGQRLQNLGIKFDRLVISTMTRAQETGGLIAESLPDVEQEHCSLLREGRPWRPESTRSRFDSKSWKVGVFVDNPRIEGAFRKYIHRAEPEQTEDSYDVLVCHANVIRYFVVRALQFPPEYWLKMSLAHASITWITIPPSGEVSVCKYGESGHLPPDLVTFSNTEPPPPPPSEKNQD